MTVLRVDTYPGELNSVVLKQASSPYTTVATILLADITEVADGAYEVNVGAIAGNWMLVLYDVTGEAMGIRYASDTYTQAEDAPPWENSATSGPYLLTLTVVDDSALPLAGVSVRIVNGPSSATLTTGIDGIAQFGIAAGAWSVYISHPGYSYTPVTETVVADKSATITLTAISSTVPTDPQLSLVNFYVWGDEAPLVGARVVARIEAMNALTSTHLIGKVVHRATTDATGLAQLQLVKASAFTDATKAVYIIEVFDSSANPLYELRVTVPDVDVQNASNLTKVEN